MTFVYDWTKLKSQHVKQLKRRNWVREDEVRQGGMRALEPLDNMVVAGVLLVKITTLKQSYMNRINLH